jgi:hypothetical protein
VVSYSSYFDPNGYGDPDPSLIANDLTAVRRLKDSGALIITVGVGVNRDPGHLLQLATNPSYYHDYADFDDLTGREADVIAVQACNYVPTGDFFPCEMEVVQADFVFVVDISSTNFNSDYAGYVTTFINNTLAPYTFNHKTGVQASLVTYQKDADVAIQLKDYNTHASFISAVQSSLAQPCDKSDRCVKDALNKVVNEVLVPEAGYRSTCTVHFVYIFTVDCFTCGDPMPNANAIKNLPNTEIFVVPMNVPTPPGFWKEYLELATDADHLLEVQPNPEAIMTNYLHKEAWRSVCDAFEVAQCSPSNTTTPIPPLRGPRPAIRY